MEPQAMVIHDVCPAKMRTEEQVPTAHKHDLGQQTRAEVMVGLGKRYTRSVQSQAFIEHFEPGSVPST